MRRFAEVAVGDGEIGDGVQNGVDVEL